MGKRFAIIDLGTNTFNLLIAEAIGNTAYQVLYSTKEGVKLGEGGINKRFITEAAFQRGIDAVSRHYERIQPYHVDKIIAFATSAIRDAENGSEFTLALIEKFGLEIQVIDGGTEAELIYLGVKQTLSFSNKCFIILDIGGGSNEFIIADDNGILWKKSFPLGMARLLDRFRPSDPITISEVASIELYLEGELPELFNKVKELKPEIFVGASGSFDSFILMLTDIGLIERKAGAISQLIPLDAYKHLHRKIILSTSAERELMKGLEPVRRDMIVLAAVFVNFVLNKLNLKTLHQSAYSLKEGALLKMVNELR